MENYENLGTIGEGTYGIVLKCRHKETGQIVAIKKFKESDDDEQVRKTALREIRLLKQLRHDNVVNLIEVFRRKGKLHLVFEFVERTVLEELESNPEGLSSSRVRSLMWQLLRAVKFCHDKNIIHRDIKPENLLVSKNGVLKLCDFGFARPLASAGAKYTDYVSTRWYRAPELLVGDVSYGKPVDIWAIGCMIAEISKGVPLFPGDSDIDQLYHIIKCFGSVPPRQKELFRKNPLYAGVNMPTAHGIESLDERYPDFDKNLLDLMKMMLIAEPLDRWTCGELLNHPYFQGHWDELEEELRVTLARDQTADEVPGEGKKAKRSNSSQKPSKSNKNNIPDVKSPRLDDSTELIPSDNTRSLKKSHTIKKKAEEKEMPVFSPTKSDYSSKYFSHQIDVSKHLPVKDTVEKSQLGKLIAKQHSVLDHNNSYDENTKMLPTLTPRKISYHQVENLVHPRGNNNAPTPTNSNEDAFKICSSKTTHKSSTNKQNVDSTISRMKKKSIKSVHTTQLNFDHDAYAPTDSTISTSSIGTLQGNTSSLKSHRLHTLSTKSYQNSHIEPKQPGNGLWSNIKRSTEDNLRNPLADSVPNRPFLPKSKKLSMPKITGASKLVHIGGGLNLSFGSSATTQPSSTQAY